ncbi:MAG: DUF63 family protein [Haloarculaceae archaeon]
MATPFEGFVLPEPPLLVGLLVATAVVVALLFVVKPPVTERFVPAVVPWVFVGAALHVIYQVGAVFELQIYPPVVESLFSAPAVYLTTFVAMGIAWLGSFAVAGETDRPGRSTRTLGWPGLAVAVVVAALLLWVSQDPEVGPIRLLVPGVGVVASVAVTAAVYLALRARRPAVVDQAPIAGALVLFAHTLDGITTALGVDVLGVGERSLLPRRIMDLAADLPTAEFLGTGWLFIVVKIGVAVALVWAFADIVREDPVRGSLLFAVLMAVGLGPAFNNLLLFFLGG